MTSGAHLNQNTVSYSCLSEKASFNMKDKSSWASTIPALKILNSCQKSHSVNQNTLNDLCITTEQVAEKMPKNTVVTGTCWPSSSLTAFRWSKLLTTKTSHHCKRALTGMHALSHPRVQTGEAWIWRMDNVVNKELTRWTQPQKSMALHPGEDW